MLKRSVIVVLVAVHLVAMVLIAPTVSGQEASWPTDTWPASIPEAQGMSSEELAAYFETWSQPQFNLDSMIVVRHGYIVAEAYGPLTGPDDIRPGFSVTKSVTGALIGILLQEGLLESLDTPVLALFPDRTVENVDAEKQAITVRDLLTMGSGLECNDMTAGPDELPTSDMMETSDDWLQFVLDLPMVAAPGTQWYYCNAHEHILSGIITELTGMSAADYAAEKLFAPLGITNYEWASDPNGVTVGYSELRLTARDMAKFGYLYLNGGQWAGQQIIPADYAQASLGRQIDTPWAVDADTVYGYLWWRINSINLSFALGFGGKYIMVMPDKDLVVVVTSTVTETPRAGWQAYPMFFATAGLSAADESLPENPDAASALDVIVQKIHAPDPQPVPDLPALASEINNQVFGLSAPRLFMAGKHYKRPYSGLADLLGVNWFMLSFDDSAEAMLTLGFTDNQMETLPVGLDGLYRVSEGRMGTVGVKGEWLGESTFRVYLMNNDDAFLHRIDINFIPGGIDILSYEYASGQAIALQGVAMQ